MRLLGRLAKLRRPGWKVIVVSVVVVLLGTIYGIRKTSQPLLCYACHEMRYEYRTWSQSGHKNVNCEVCHVHPSIPGMVSAKVKGLGMVIKHITTPQERLERTVITAEVPDLRCLLCHKDIRQKETMNYHSLKITHRMHLDRGYHCTDCHANLVHGGNAPAKNTPTMEVCFKCHDGKAAPNNCSLCHSQLGEIRAPLYNPEWVQEHKRNIQDTGLDRCQTCHQHDFCTSCHRTGNPHGTDWLDQHRTAGADPKPCYQCHGEPTPTGEPKFCKDCHQARREHTEVGWVTDAHQQEYRRQPETCWRCHQSDFCSDCHSIYKPHGSGWIAQHPAQATAKPDSCKTCHEEQFCTSCHRQEVPENHKDAQRWLKAHRLEVDVNGKGCSVCHTPDFCQACHRTHKPESHDKTWLDTHGGVALVRDVACKTCHGQAFCDKCHGIAMPHPRGWEKAHPGRAGTKVCSKCHEENYCAACHGVQVPHPKDWGKSHAGVARDNRSVCSRCHSASECQKCHATSAPSSHSGQWERTHGDRALQDRVSCLICHDEKSFCNACHGLAMPHPRDWATVEHPKQAMATPATCSQCHEEADCLVCHGKSPPSSHASADWKPKGHQGGQEAFCILCHGKNPCLTCHGLQMPHPAGYDETHSKEASFDAGSVCFRCHSKTDFCSQCH